MARHRKTTAAETAAVATSNAPWASVVSLREEQCWKETDLSHVSFETTDNLAPISGVIEQERAIEALELGLGIDRRSYNIYVAGPSGTGKRTQLKLLLDKLSPTKPTPNDWVYLHNFKENDAPVAVSLKPGEGRALKKSLEEFLEFLKRELPKSFHSRGHQEKLQRILSTSALRENESFENLNREASAVGFAVKNTKRGLVMVPVVNEQALSRRGLEALPEKEKKRIEKQRSKLDPLILSFLERTRDIENETELKLQESLRKLGMQVTQKSFDAIKKRFAECGPKLQAYFDALYAHILDNLERFLPSSTGAEAEEEAQRPMLVPEELEQESKDPFVAFAVHVVVDHSETKGAPVVFETHPTFYRMFGKIERRVEQGMLLTDHRMIHAGSVAKANGGYLVFHAQDLFQFPGVWENLKSTLRNREVRVEDIGESAGVVPTSGLKPDAIPVDVKIIMIGSNSLYHRLYRLDEDFRKLFQVKSDFDYEIKRSADVLTNYARFVATTVKNSKLLPANRSAVAAVIEHSAREVESQEKLTLRFNEIANLLTEADFHARREGATLMTRAHIETAVRAREQRSSLIADKMHEEISEQQIFIDTTGTRIGVINGLAVYNIGEYQFGRPSRITARCFAGRSAIINIERQSRLSGTSHDKGVLILGGLLGDLFAKKQPLGLTVSIAFEQSYGPIDGDSAQLAELYCILSAIAEVPLSQGIALTGSLNQIGEVQPIGGVNHKIEGFFRLCEERGLVGNQGVIIPEKNVQNLMLSRDVRAAVRDGKFHIWPVSRFEQGLTLMTGLDTGVYQDDGYDPSTLLGKAAARLAVFATARRAAGESNVR